MILSQLSKSLGRNSQIVPQTETLVLNWDFEKVTGSDSNGRFIVEDVSQFNYNGF